MKEVYRSPWYDPQGYFICIVIYEDGSRKTLLQHREIMKKILGRELTSNEVVHHKDGNKRNNDPSNLELMDREEHTAHHVLPAEMIMLTCVECNATFEKTASYEKRRRSKKKTGPYCSRPCSGIATRRMQLARGIKAGRKPKMA